IQRPRIILAEDHAEMAEQLRNLLASEFDVVALVADWQALLPAAETTHPDVVVTARARRHRGDGRPPRQAARRVRGPRHRSGRAPSWWSAAKPAVLSASSPSTAPATSWCPR